MSSDLTYSRSQIVKAGKYLRKEEPSEDNLNDYNRAMDVVGFWRSAHAIPLQEATLELEETAKKVVSHVLVAKREKRARSIIQKLKRETSMSLATMQDIGGCRAIVKKPKDVKKVATALRRKRHIKTKNNYLKKPKADGYRGFHLVGYFENPDCKKISIEYQVRTRIQHAWATAGEITELFTSKSIKHIGGDEEWKTLYRGLADLFDFIDNRIVRNLDFEKVSVEELSVFARSNLGEKEKKMARDLKRRADDLNMQDSFIGYTSSLRFANEQLAEEQLLDGYILVRIDIEKTELGLTHYSNSQTQEAQTEYIELEKAISNNPKMIVALVSSQAVGGIKEAYPNYFADSHLFMKLFIGLTDV